MIVKVAQQYHQVPWSTFHIINWNCDNHNTPNYTYVIANDCPNYNLRAVQKLICSKDFKIKIRVQ